MFAFEINEIVNKSKDDDGSRFLQSSFWIAFKCAHGWTSKFFEIKVTGAKVSFSFSLGILLRSFKKLFTIVYIPMAPEMQMSDAVESIAEYSSLLIELAENLKSYLPKNTLCVRYDVPLDFYSTDERDFYVTSLKNLAIYKKLPLKKTKVDIQPPDTTILDLTQTEDAILSNMKSKWRYNIHLAEKKGVTIKSFHANDDNFNQAVDNFYALFETTSERDGIAHHAKSYYKSLLIQSDEWRKTSNAANVTLYLAEHEGDVLAGIITLFSKREAVYLYGASGNLKRNLMPAYLLQWNAIKDAKSYGAKEYDFYGMPPTDNEKHPMHGLYRFKTGFGGKIVHRVGSIDIPVSKSYGFYTFLESLRAFYHKRIKKIIRGR